MGNETRVLSKRFAREVCKVFLSMCLFVSMCLFAQKSAAFPQTKEELALLPEYCAVRYSAHGPHADAAKVEKWRRVFGRDWNVMHHYCNQLDHINKARRIVGNDMLRDRELESALNGLDNMRRQVSKGFVLLPELFLKKGEVLLDLKRPRDAVKEFYKAIQVRRGYVPAYAALSDYYVNSGKKDEAIRILQQGVKNAPKSARLRARLAKLTAGREVE